ncbi:MAG TPA: stage II sporulation protein M, partial [Flavobacterium sp.]|nr:stage II sporulation protein M [Flavobacterium sp.]
FPRTYSRIDSLKIGFRNSFKIFLSTMPFTIAAAVLEGFVTRYANGLPDVVNLAIILSTLSIISYYYIIYPYRVARRMQNEQHAS